MHLRQVLPLIAAGAALGAELRVEVGRPSPAFAVAAADGHKLDLAQLRGKRVLVFMWASW